MVYSPPELHGPYSQLSLSTNMLPRSISIGAENTKPVEESRSTYQAFGLVGRFTHEVQDCGSCFDVAQQVRIRHGALTASSATSFVRSFGLTDKSFPSWFLKY